MLLPFFAFVISISITSATDPPLNSSRDATHFFEANVPAVAGLLYPQTSETRDLRILDGIWNFRKSPSDSNYGYQHRWYETDLDKGSSCPLSHLIESDDKPKMEMSFDRNPQPQEASGQTGEVIPMPVPSSYNDVTQDASLRDHVGLVWYDTRFWVPSSWLHTGQRVWLRFGGVHYAAQIWINGRNVHHHEIGHLPFEVEVTQYVHSNASNLLTVVVDNVLTSETIPQGNVVLSGSTLKQEYTFDFFNYAGIHRSVFLYATPKMYIDDVVVNYDIRGKTGIVKYKLKYQGNNTNQVQCLVQIFDKNNIKVQENKSDDCVGTLEVSEAKFWWPYLMHPEPGYLYTLKASLVGFDGAVIDTYTQKVGIRTVSTTNTSILINDKPVYLRGFGMHEDSNLRGKGWDPVLWVKNFNLIKWVGANVFRTSHYPYAEEIYQLADEQGIMIIDECPGVDIDIYSDQLLKNHMQSLSELIHRDKNHPSVIMWSIANEARSGNELAYDYFKKVAEHTKSLDMSRPITAAIHIELEDDKSAPHLDVISFNRYNCWYFQEGQLQEVFENVVQEAEAWHKTYNKPVLMSEYGADSMPGLHFSPEVIWSEDYQVAVMAEHFKAFDQLKEQNEGFVGEFIWNFADFMTKQQYHRVAGNRKGIFTRDRQPKAAAVHMRTRYLELAAADSGAAPPPPLWYTSNQKQRQEL